MEAITGRRDQHFHPDADFVTGTTGVTNAQNIQLWTQENRESKAAVLSV